MTPWRNVPNGKTCALILYSLNIYRKRCVGKFPAALTLMLNPHFKLLEVRQAIPGE